MEPPIFYLIIFVGFIIVILFFLLRFKGEAGTEISLFDKLKLRVWGKNKQSDDGDIPSTTVSIRESKIEGDVVAGNKFTQIVSDAHKSESSKNKPELDISFYDRDKVIKKRISSFQRPKLAQGKVVFLLALQNTTVESVVKGISIRLEFYWRGAIPSKAPSIMRLGVPSEWTVEAAKLIDSNPAVLTYNSAEKIVAYGQPEILKVPRIVINEELHGNFLIKYRVSSHDPPSQADGDLEIHIEYIS
ncbi:MAG: hypothetical protein E3J37_06890 [Anaerolineales bacterium]|nr:MAG: hypothetical protein E3J37_06890 [Anaerolineales bacterium]